MQLISKINNGSGRSVGKGKRDLPVSRGWITTSLKFHPLERQVIPQNEIKQFVGASEATGYRRNKDGP